MHPSEEDSRLISGDGPVNRRTALKQQHRAQQQRSERPAPAALQQRIERVHTRNRFGAPLLEQLAASRASAQAPASGAQIALGVLAACGAVVALLGAIQSLVLVLVSGAVLAGCGALGGVIVQRKTAAAAQASAAAPGWGGGGAPRGGVMAQPNPPAAAQAGAAPPAWFDPAALAAFDAALETAAAELDDDNAAQLLAIKAAFQRLAPQAGAPDEHFTVDDRLYLRECLRRYVPDSVTAYLRVPAAQRSEALLDGQPCAQSALRQQLDLLLEEILLREKKIGRSAAEPLLSQQRFLDAKKSR